MLFLQVRAVAPSEEELLLRKRAERFGIDYQPDDTGLMDVGEAA